MLDDTSFVASVRQPRLFVQGEHDQFGGADEIASVVKPLSPPRTLVVVPGADHFFSGHLEALQAAVAAWAAAAPWAVG
jgi:alpha/beta superfamily hydrolase